MSLRSSLLCTALLALAACGGDEEFVPVEGVIDRETFVATYVDLRSATIAGAELTLPNEERDRILARHGVEAESLLEFVEAYGRELDFMNQVWSEVQQRLDSLPPEPARSDLSNS